MKRIISLLLLVFLGCESEDYKKGMICLRQGDAERAVFFLDATILENPENLPARHALAQALEQELRSLDKAHADLAEHWRRVVNEYRIVFRQGDSLASTPLQESWLNWCGVLQEQGDSAQAALQYREMLQWFPENLDAYNEAALLAFRRLRWGEAEDYWKKAIVLDSLSITAPFNYGMAFWMRGDARGALLQWVEAFERNPLDTNVVSWMMEARKMVVP